MARRRGRGDALDVPLGLADLAGDRGGGDAAATGSSQTNPKETPVASVLEAVLDDEKTAAYSPDITTGGEQIHRKTTGGAGGAGGGLECHR